LISFNFENDLSAEADVTGIVIKMIIPVKTSGNMEVKSSLIMIYPKF